MVTGNVLSTASGHPDRLRKPATSARWICSISGSHAPAATHRSRSASRKRIITTSRSVAARFTRQVELSIEFDQTIANGGSFKLHVTALEQASLPVPEAPLNLFHVASA
jgi:hypothetical protein